MVEKAKKFIVPLVLVFSVLVFFYPFILFHKLPIPADTIIGLYHPYRDLYALTYPNGIPYKNFLITDPVRQTYVWKELAMVGGQLPLWNPYEMTGKPLLANFQSGVFYPLNIILFIPPFSVSWSVFIILQVVLACLFLYLFLRNIQIDRRAAFFASIAFAFSGFSVAWLEWGTIVQTALWLPLILLANDKLLRRISTKWIVILIFAQASMFFAGHLQTFFYAFILSNAYLIAKIVVSLRHKKKLSNSEIVKRISPYVISGFFVFVLISVQLFPTLQFILLSNRASDLMWIEPGWFLPLQNLVQFIAPDFFGNPSTLNYFGIWNYGEFVGYVGIGTLIFSLYAVLFRRDRKTIFFTLIMVLGLLFATENPVSKVLYITKIPFLSTAQPTRLMFVICFALVVLAALGFDLYLRFKKNIWIPIIIIGMIFVGLWIIVLTNILGPENSLVAKSNLKLPTLVFVFSSLLLFVPLLLKNKRIVNTLVICFIALLLFDVMRFGWKFTPFTNVSYLFPQTKVINFLKSDRTLYRVAVLDRRIMPPNFFTHYKIQTIEGYDPLYLKSYGKFISLFESEGKDSEQVNFNRIITPHNYNTQLFDFLNVKYVLAFDEIKSEKLAKVFSEGQTKVYLNKKYFERIFFVSKVESASRDNSKLFHSDLRNTAYVEGSIPVGNMSIGKVANVLYEENSVSFETTNDGEGFLVMSDAYYPTWHAYIDGNKTPIYKVNISFRGIVVPKGQHKVQFKNSLF